MIGKNSASDCGRSKALECGYRVDKLGLYSNLIFVSLSTLSMA